ncbi:MAG: hypothetical protein ACXADC_12155 [Candidatus Thorarchaeota archaeon]
MNSKTKATAIILILVIGGVAALYLAFFQPGIPPEQNSPLHGDIWISEVHMNSSLAVDEEFFEIYIPATLSTTTLSGLEITTFDDEGMVALPSIMNVDAEDYIAVYTGTGTNDIDASDSRAEIHLGLEDRILDPTGDEIAIYDDSGLIVDFMRYNGGNGDGVQSSWPASDDGPSLPIDHSGSLSFFGTQYTNSSNWLHSLITAGYPNQFAFLSEDEVYLIIITSGVTTDYSFLGISDEKMSGKNETVDVNAGAGVDAATVKQIEENIKFSLQFYNDKGFTNGPATSSPGKIKVTARNGTSTETTGSTSQNGDIVINIGTIKSKIDLKYVVEHELMHAFQFKQGKEGNDTVDHAPVTNKWWIEGQATYWGIESTKANYNLTNVQIQDEFDRVGDHNWNDHYTDLNRSIFIGWGGSYSDYMGSYLFMKFIKEKYGEDKLKDAFDKAKDNFNNDSKDKSPEDAVAEATGKSWDQLVAEFYAWMMTGAITDNGVPERTGHVNVTYTNNTVSDTLKVGPYASGVERIKVNGTQPFQIDIKPSSGKWKITIIYVYEDGSRKQGDNTPYTISGTSAPWPVNPGAHDKKLVEIIVIKTLVQTGSAVSINMTVSPVDYLSPLGPDPLIPDSWWDWALPPFFGNYTDPADGLWSHWFWFNNSDDTSIPIVEINVNEHQVDSFFDVILYRTRIPFHEWQNISRDTTHVFDLQGAPLDEYQLEIRQSTWDSVGSGNITLYTVPRAGATSSDPFWHTVDTKDRLDVSLPFSVNGTGALYINVSVLIGQSYWFYFNTTMPWMETASRIWNGTGWTFFQYNPGMDWYEVLVMSETDTLMIEIYTEAPDSFLFCFWSVWT